MSAAFAGLVYRVQLLLLLMMLLLTTLKASNMQPSSWYFVQLVVIKVFEKKMINVLGLKAACLDGILFLWQVNFSSLGHISPCTSSDFVQVVQQLVLVADVIPCTHVFTDSFP